jgi:NAD(P)-dependent dehydrogenase (short-subunit alcohol dehydrogenase family)
MIKVTGGGSGLGRAICFRLADLGCNIAVADIDLNSAEKAADEIRSRGVKAKAYRVDITKQIDVTKLRDDVCMDFGVVDILVRLKNIYFLHNKNNNMSKQIIVTRVALIKILEMFVDK